MIKNKGLITLYIVLLLTIIILSYVAIYLETILLLYDLASTSIFCDEFIIETKSFSASLARLSLINILRYLKNNTLTIKDLAEIRNFVESQIYKAFNYLLENFPRRLNFSATITQILINKYNNYNIYGFFNRIAYHNIVPQNFTSDELIYCTGVRIIITYEVLVENKLYLKRSDSIELLVPLRYYLVLKIISEINEEMSKENINNIYYALNKLELKINNKYKYVKIKLLYKKYILKYSNESRNIIVYIKIIVEDYFINIMIKDSSIKIIYIAVLRKNYIQYSDLTEGY